MKKSILTISTLVATATLFSAPVFAESEQQRSSSMEMSQDLAANNVGEQDDSDSIGVNPFRGQGSNVEEIERKIRQKEKEIELIEKEYEVAKKKADAEFLPYKTETERLRLMKVLYDAQKEATPDPELPNVTRSDIENRIDQVAGEIIKKKEEQIESLSKQLVKEEKAANTFSLQLVATDGSDHPFAVISNSAGDHRVKTGSVVEGWKVVTISPETNRVLVKKGNRQEIVTPPINSRSTISFTGRTSSSKSGETSGRNGDGMPNPDLLPPPNFN